MVFEEVDNISKWSIRIKASDELNKTILETSKTLQNSNNINILSQCANLGENVKRVNFYKNELLILQNLENIELETENLEKEIENTKFPDLINNSEGVDNYCNSQEKINKNKYIDTECENQEEEICDLFGLSNPYLQLSHIKWFHSKISINKYEKEVKYLHDILVACRIILPTNTLKRNPILEARCQMLRAKQENQKYKNMTRNIDSTRSTLPEDTISYQVKAINKQLIAVLQFIFSVAAGFAFGFIGIELIIGNMDFGFRLLLGIICALTIALAEMYFLAKKLNEMDKMTTDQDKKNR